MSIAVEPIHYPESDGKPIAETDVHRDEMVYFIEALRTWLRSEEAYVSGNILLLPRGLPEGVRLAGLPGGLRTPGR